MRRPLTLGLGLLLCALPACTDGGADSEDGTESAADSNSNGSESNGDGDGDGDVPWDEVRSDMPHDAEPMPSPEDQMALADGQWAFSLELFRNLRASEPGNFAISGVSIQLAFGA